MNEVETKQQLKAKSENTHDLTVKVFGHDIASVLQICEWALEIDVPLDQVTWERIKADFARLAGAAGRFPLLASSLASPLYSYNPLHHIHLFRSWALDDNVKGIGTIITGDDRPFLLARCEFCLIAEYGLSPETWELVEQTFPMVPNSGRLFPTLAQELCNPFRAFHSVYWKGAYQRMVANGSTSASAKHSDPTGLLVKCQCLLEAGLAMQDETQTAARIALQTVPSGQTSFSLVARYLDDPQPVTPITRGEAPSAPFRQPLSDAMQELGSLTGLASVKEEIRRIRSRVRFDQERGITSSYRHFMFTGNPGTGKTTVARILGRILKEVGFLKTTNFVEASRSTLVAGYIGQTAGLVQEQIERALDGVLFIDEAHMLASSESKNDFGHEALSQINKAMEDYRHRLVVIFAGYTEPIQRLYALEPGLESRITRTINFLDYSIDEMIQIFDREITSRGIKIVGQKPEAIRYMIANELSGILEERGSQNFGNARGVRNIVERLIDEHAYRSDAQNIRGSAANDIPLETALSVLRTMYSKHPGEDFDMALSKYGQAEMRKSVDRLGDLISQAKEIHSFGEPIGVVVELEERDGWYCLILADSSDKNAGLMFEHDDPMAGTLDMLEAGKAVTKLNLGEGKSFLLPGDFDEQLEIAEIMLQTQWQLLTDMEKGLTMGEAMERQLEEGVSSGVSACAECQKTVPPNSKFCPSCGGRVASANCGANLT